MLIFCSSNVHVDRFCSFYSPSQVRSLNFGVRLLPHALDGRQVAIKHYGEQYESSDEVVQPIAAKAEARRCDRRARLEETKARNSPIRTMIIDYSHFLHSLIGLILLVLSIAKIMHYCIWGKNLSWWGLMPQKAVFWEKIQDKWNLATSRPFETL